MKWRKEPPDKPGWWWMREPGKSPEIALVAVASWLGGKLFAITTGAAPPVDTISAEWAGPIKEPQEDE